MKKKMKTLRLVKVYSTEATVRSNWQPMTSENDM